MIKSFRNEATRRLFADQDARAFRGLDLKRALNRLNYLQNAGSLAGIPNLSSFDLHALKGSRQGQWAISVNRRWRICFEYRDGDAYNVEV
ncbi:MAG TPA: type II toxin-antitoxin system RelE/ParE family toxin, partial [Candidatus Binataceae bacterium]|nr:type II toxin-antitoxin system RelE/ParE family toxin [Candidatus Binataceae bacterium]